MLPPSRLISGVTTHAAEARRLIHPLKIVGAGFDQALAERAVGEESSLLHLYPALQLVVGEFLVSDNLNLCHFVARPFNNAKKNCLAVWCGLNIGLHRDIEITLRLEV